MDKELKDKWVQTLRSGEYQQAFGTFEDRQGGCCVLGVLCKAAGIPTNSGVGIGNYSAVTDILGDAVAKTLWRLNDGVDVAKEYTFAELADYIEANL